MTRQRLDTVRYQGRAWAQLALHGEGGFDPRLHGFDPRARSTALDRGWYGEFSAEPRLRLDELHVNHEVDGLLPVLQRRALGPVFNAVSPQRSLSGACNTVYRDLSLHIAFSGGIVLVRDYDASLGGRYGNRFWMYGEACELIYRRGRLVEAIDHASTIALARGLLPALPEPASAGLGEASLDTPARERVAACFRHAYRPLS